MFSENENKDKTILFIIILILFIVLFALVFKYFYQNSINQQILNFKELQKDKLNFVQKDIDRILNNLVELPAANVNNNFQNKTDFLDFKKNFSLSGLNSVNNTFLFELNNKEINILESLNSESKYLSSSKFVSLFEKDILQLDKIENRNDYIISKIRVKNDSIYISIFYPLSLVKGKNYAAVVYDIKNLFLRRL